MNLANAHFFPLTPVFLVGLALLLVFLVVLVEVGLLGYAYEKIGVGRRYVFAVLVLSLVGSYVNIPLVQLPPERVISNQVVSFFGIEYVIPMVRSWPGTLLTVNLGGAVIPSVLSLYLLIKNKLYLRGLLGVAVVTVVVHFLAQPVRGIGIAVPTFVPPLVAAGVALLLSRRSAPAVAYISGSLGTLIGADLLNLDKIQGLGAPVASIGGAGTFDGVFLTGILAALLA